MAEIKTYTLPPNFSAALLVIAGEYGNGNERITALKKEGYDPSTVQKAVNDILKVMNNYG